MFGIQKPSLLIWSVIFSSIVLTSCSHEAVVEGIDFFGETQGTTYHVIIAEEATTVTQSQIDSLLHAFDLSLSTYIDSSVISKLNAADTALKIDDASGFFRACYTESKHVFELTNGAFDPTVFPLVQGWGFMNNPQNPLNQKEVDSILQFVGFDRNHTVSFVGNSVHIFKEKSGIKLDFNAIAQGYSVDVLAQFLKAKGHTNFYVEIGGELVVSGVNRTGDKWSIGVDVPESNAEGRPIENILLLSNNAIATSGNYRKFYEVDGQKYAHTLDPKTGFPVQHSLLSASVIAPNCAQADAFATAFMVLGAEKTLAFVKSHPELELEVYLLVSNTEGTFDRLMSPGFKKFLKN